MAKEYDYVKPSAKIESLRRDYQNSLYELFKKDPIVSKEFPGDFRLSDIGYGRLEIQVYRIVSPRAQAQVEEIIKSTVSTTYFTGGTIEFYKDRLTSSSSEYNGKEFVSLLKKVPFESTKSKETEQDAAANP